MPTQYARELQAAAATFKAALDPELAALVDDLIGIADCLDADDKVNAAEDMQSNLRRLVNQLAEEAMAGYDRRTKEHLK